jgi:hypothetical protein
MSSGDSHCRPNAFGGTGRVVVLMVASLALASCSGPASPPSGQGTPSGAITSQASTPASQPPTPTPSIGHDGSTLLPPSDLGCDRLTPEQIQRVLGSAAASLQPVESDGNIAPEGVRRVSCIYPLDAERTTTHALVLEESTFPSAEALQASAPFESLKDPVEVEGLQGMARFARLELSSSVENVLVIIDGPKLTRLIISQPPSTSWNSDDALAALRQLAAPS